MPQYVVPAIIAVAVLVALAGLADALIAHPAILVLIVAVLGGAIYFYVSRKRARNRV